MNRQELVDAIAVKADISKKDADAAVKAFIEVVSDELQNKGKVQGMMLSGYYFTVGNFPVPFPFSSPSFPYIFVKH